MNNDKALALAAELRATEKYKDYKVDRPLNEVDEATGILWLGLQYERGVYEERLAVADRIEALAAGKDEALEAHRIAFWELIQTLSSPAVESSVTILMKREQSDNIGHAIAKSVGTMNALATGAALPDPSDLTINFEKGVVIIPKDEWREFTAALATGAAGSEPVKYPDPTPLGMCGIETDKLHPLNPDKCIDWHLYSEFYHREPPATSVSGEACEHPTKTGSPTGWKCLECGHAEVTWKRVATADEEEKS